MLDDSTGIIMACICLMTSLKSWSLVTPIKHALLNYLNFISWHGFLLWQVKIQELTNEKVDRLLENTNLMDQLRKLSVECRQQEKDLNIHAKTVVSIPVVAIC
jgi:hypothetical protein